MQAITIELQDGFKDDAVIIRVNDYEIMQAERVGSGSHTGFPIGTTSVVCDGKTTVGVALPQAGIRGMIEAEVSAPTWIGVSLDRARVLHFTISQSPFERAQASGAAVAT